MLFTSAAKPLQALPVISSGALSHFGIQEHELAVICGSHMGEDRHVEAVRSILTKVGLKDSHLLCGVHEPYSKVSRRVLISEGIAAGAVHNNCSGKHAGMLAACRMRGWDIESYTEVDHPLQREIAGYVSEYCGIDPDLMHTETDGCGVPAFAVNLLEAASAYSRLMSGASGSEAGIIRHAMMAYPEMVSGKDHFVAELIRNVPGVIVKTGGEALLGIGVEAGRVPAEFGGRELGIALKCEDGNSLRGTYPAALELLSRVGVITPGELALLQDFHAVPIFNRHGIEVGAIRVDRR
jgi:L-asparaginase II